MKPTPITSAISPDDLIKVAIYGDQGIGKTTSLTTFPGKKAVINTTQGGLVSIANAQDVDVLDLSVLPPAKAAAQLESMSTQFMNGNLGDLKDYDTICVDDFSGLMDIFMARAMGSSIAKSRSLSIIPTLKHYMAESTLCFNFLMSLMVASSTAHKPFVCTFHVNQDISDGGAVTAIYPRVRGRDRGSNIMRNFSEVYYMTSKTELKGGKAQEKRIWRTTGTRVISAKSRLKGLWPEMPEEIEPNFGPIYQHIIELSNKEYNLELF